MQENHFQSGSTKPLATAPARAQNYSCKIILPGLALPGLSLLALLGTGGLMAGLLAKAPPAQVQMAGYSTSLKGRSRSQRRNAQLAANSLNGRIIPPGGVFSFNTVVKSWSVDQGYVKALVSYDGELVRAYGGGVCQTSTTLYNTALLAGLPILERHPHVFVPGYVTPGRDAAVAYPGIDLRFKNPYQWPIRMQAQIDGDRLEVKLLGARKGRAVQIKSEMLSITTPQRLTRIRYRAARDEGSLPPRRSYLHSQGTMGYRAVTSRVFTRAGRETRREMLSDDTYPSMDRVVALTRDRP